MKRIPEHLAIILDGNGRWATKRHLSRNMGHLYGVINLKKIIRVIFDMNVKYLSCYCLSTENLKRPVDEVNYLFNLLDKYLNENLNTLINNNVKVVVSGTFDNLPNNVIDCIKKVVNATKNNNKNILNLCFNYGSHKELTDACIKIAKQVKDNKLDIKNINEKTIEDNLYNNELPPVDLLIRTSNELRLSNFMLWQISYAELYFTKKNWPSFNKKDLNKAFISYGKRNRRFGGIK